MHVYCTAHSAFRVSSVNDTGRSHVLQANDELDKRHWLQCIDEALSHEVLPVTSAKLNRHSSDASSTGTLSADFQSPTNSSEACSSALGSEESVESYTNSAVEKLPTLTPFTSSSLRVSKHMFEEL